MITHNKIINNFYSYTHINVDNKLNEYKHYLKKFYDKFINKKYDEIVKELLSYKFKCDQYMITVNYILICLNKLKNINETTVEKSNETTMEKSSKKLIYFLLELLIYNLNPDPYKRLKKYEFKKILSICFKSTENLKKINDKIKEENIIFHEYLIAPDFSIFTHKDIVDFINSLQKDLNI